MNKELFKRAVKRTTAVEIVIDTIKNLLISKKLKPGDLIPSENDLSQSLSISRGSIREAMKILSAFGVVEVRQGDGTYIATSANRKLFDPLLFNLLVTAPDIEELVELRLMVEEGIAKLIIKHAEQSDLDELEKAYMDMEENAKNHPGDREKAFQYDVNFHLVMGKITKNKLVQNVYSFVVELYAPTMHPDRGLESHRRLVDSLYKRDLDSALSTINEHDKIWHDAIEADRQ